MNLRMILTTATITVTASACCFGGSSSPTPPIELPGTGPAALPAIAPVAPAATSTLTLGPGFAPDPTTVQTTAGGPVPASGMGAMCRGTFPAAPNVMLTTTAPMATLRVLARASADTTLAIRLADGRVLCDDDGGGYPNPAITSDFPAGTHQVFVGNYNSTALGVAVTLGFTTNGMMQSSALP